MTWKLINFYESGVGGVAHGGDVAVGGFGVKVDVGC